jgi:hypothetical protein
MAENNSFFAVSAMALVDVRNGTPARASEPVRKTPRRVNNRLSASFMMFSMELANGSE